MPPRDQTVISDALRRLGTLAGLNKQQLEALAGEAEMRKAPQGACLRELGDHDPHLMFLLDGELQLTAADGASHVVRAEDTEATGPVSRLRPSRYRITARTDVCYLLLDQQMLDEVMYVAETESMVVEWYVLTMRNKDMR